MVDVRDIDIEAAQLFRPAGGMLAGWRGSRDGIIHVRQRLRDGVEATPDAYDTDDCNVRGTAECDGTCAPLCGWCLAAHVCHDDCGGGDGYPYNALARDAGRALPFGE